MGGKGIFIFLVKERTEKHFSTAQFDALLILHSSSFYKTKHLLVQNDIHSEIIF